MKESTGKKIGESIRTADSLASEIVQLARSGDFQKAEQLRAYLLEKHPMALGAIISTGETIEEQKTLRIDHDHLAIWDKLYSNLSQEEQNCLFYATKSATIAAGKVLIRQGKPVQRLLFIDSGRVTLFHSKGDERILIGQLSRGDILGDETFFGLSSPTFSAGAQTDVSLRYLDKPSTAAWEESQPGLYQKIADYCLQNNRSVLLLKQKNIEKRLFPRIKTDNKVIAYIRGEDGRRSGESFRGSLMDLSQNGGCFDMHCSRPEIAQTLLGKTLDLEFEPSDDGGTMVPKLRGMIVKLNMMLYNDYTVHIRLLSDLSAKELKQYLR